MKFRYSLFAFVALVSVMPAHADETAPSKIAEPVVSTATSVVSPVISAGRYYVSVAPNFNAGMDKRLESALSKLPGLSDVKALPTDSTIHFTVNDKSNVRLSDIQRIVKKTDNGAVISAPVLEGSLATRPGL